MTALEKLKKLNPTGYAPTTSAATAQPETVSGTSALDRLRGVNSAGKSPTTSTLPTPAVDAGVGSTRTIDDAYAELDAANAQYSDALKRLESTNRAEAEQAKAELADLSERIKALREETAYQGTGADAFKYGAERAGAALLGAGENITDFVGAGTYKLAQDITSVGGLLPNAVSEKMGEQADKFLDNSVTRDYEQSIRERYQPTRAMEDATAVGQTVVRMLPTIGAAGAVSSSGNAINAANQAAKGAKAGQTILGLQAAGGGASEAKAEGATTDQALVYGAASGLMEATIESIAGGIPQLGKGKLRQVVDLLESSPAVAKALDIAGEGGEEGLSAFLTPYLKRAIYDKDAANATAEEIAQSVIMGMAAAGVLQVGLELPGAISNATLPLSHSQSHTTGTNAVTPTTTNTEQKTAPNATEPTMETIEVPIEFVKGIKTGFWNSDSFLRDARYDGIDFRYDSPPYASADANMRIAYWEYLRAAKDAGKSVDVKTAPNATEGAEAANEESTVINTDPAQHTDVEQKVIDEYQGAVSAYMENKNEASNQHPVLANGPTSTPKSAGAAKLASPATTVSQSEPAVNSGDTISVGAAPLGFDPYSNMISEYGIIPEGENPARVVDLPKSTDGEDRVSYTARTAMEAEVTPDEAIGEIGSAVLEGKLSYIPITNDQTTADAEAKINSKGFSRALAEWTAEVRQGKSSAELTATGAILYNNAVNGGDVKLAISILRDYAASIRAGAQAVQAARILKTLSPSHKLLVIESVVDELNRENGIEGLAGVKVDDSLVEEFLSAGTDEARNAALDKIFQNIADQIPSTLSERFTAIRYLNMLGNLKTQGRNVIGNAFNKIVRMVDRKTEALLQKAVHRKHKERIDTTLFLDKDLYKLAKEDFAAYKGEVMGEQKYSVTGGTKGDIEKAISDRRTILKNNGTWGTDEAEGAAGSLPVRYARKATDTVYKGLEFARNLTSTAMDVGDEIFAKPAYADRMARYLAAKGVTAQQWQAGEVEQKILDEARAAAIKEAQEATFRDSNQFSDAISSIGFKNADTAVKKGINTAVQGVLPFRKTPANVAVQAEKHSPFGLINTAVNAINAKNPNSEVTGNDVIKSLSESLTGFGLLLLGMACAGAGWATGGERDEEQKDANELTGVQDYAINIPGIGSMTYDWATPASMTFAMGVELERALEKYGASWSTILPLLADAGAGATNIALQMSMLQGLNGIFEDVSYSDYPIVDAAVNALLDYLTQGLTSTIGGQIERTVEEQRETTFRDKNSTLPTSAQYTIGSAMNKTPGEYQQIPYIDAWGRTEESGSLPFRAVQNLLLPGYTSAENVTAADEEIQRLIDSGISNVVPNTVSHSEKVTYKDDPDSKEEETKSRYMTADEYVKYATIKGQTSYDLVSEVIGGELYGSLSDEEKGELLNSLYEYAGHVAEEEITGGKHVSPKKVELAQNAQDELGLSEAEYLALYYKYGDTINEDKIRSAYQAGIAPEDYLIYSTGAGSYNEDGAGSLTIGERSASISESGLSQNEQLALYELYYPKWKEKADEEDIEWSTYVDYKLITYGLESDKDASGKSISGSLKKKIINSLTDAGYTYREAAELYSKIGS